MNTPDPSNTPEVAGDEILGGVYTPVDTEPYDNEFEVPDTTDSASLDNTEDDDESAAEQPSQSTESQPRALDGGIQNQTPGHHAFDQDMEYDEESVEQQVSN
jgi:hypothetical protein